MTPTDEVLATQAATLSDPAAFAELVRRHQPKILLLQQRLTGERALAEDLTQETFLRAWRKLGSFRGSGTFGGWLASLAYNVFRAHWRRTRRQREEVPLDDLALSSAAADESVSPDLERLLGVLPPQDQVILVLSYAFGLTSLEAGRVLGLPAGTVKARVHRAKAKIQAYLDERASLTPAGGSSREAPGTDPSPRRASGGATPSPGTPDVPTRTPAPGALTGGCPS